MDFDVESYRLQFVSRVFDLPRLVGAAQSWLLASWLTDYQTQ
jgi:hypothetical protein